MKHFCAILAFAVVWDDSPAEIIMFEVTLPPNRVFLFTVGGKSVDRLLHKEAIAGIAESIRVKSVENNDRSDKANKAK
jgi:hypothetical protein